MPAKPCPSCGLKNPESSTTCDCGYHFGGARLGDTGRLICPSCGATSRASALSCSCGHSFAEDTEEARHVLTHKLTIGWFSIVGGGLMIVFGLGIRMLLLLQHVPVVYFGGTIAVGIGITLNGGRMVSKARAGLAGLGARPAPPPKARVVKR